MSSQQEDLVTMPEKPRTSRGRLLSPCERQTRARNCLFPCIIYVAQGPPQALEETLTTCHSEQKEGRGPCCHKGLPQGSESWMEAAISCAGPLIADILEHVLSLIFSLAWLSLNVESGPAWLLGVQVMEAVRGTLISIYDKDKKADPRPQPSPPHTHRHAARAPGLTSPKVQGEEWKTLRTSAVHWSQVTGASNVPPYQLCSARERLLLASDVSSQLARRFQCW